MRHLLKDSQRTYSAFGLVIDSDVELAGFTPCESAGTPDICVRLGTPVVEHDEDSHIRATATGVLEASVERGREIIVDASPEADPLFTNAVVTGELFSVLLRQRGLLVLHGSSVARDGRAVGFVGDSGWGKSTLASALVDRGWKLLTDDLLVISGLGTDTTTSAAMPPALPVVIPTHPSMRLSSEAVERVGKRGRTVVGQAHALTSKLRVDHGGVFSDQPTPLSHLFVLDPRLVRTHRAVPLSAREAVQEFVLHTRGRRLLQADRVLREHLGQCVELARLVPTAHLQRQFGIEHLEALCDFVEAETATR